MPGVTWWKLTNSIMVRRAGRKPTFARPAASVSLGSFETFAASRPNVGNGVKGRLCADVLVIPIM